MICYKPITDMNDISKEFNGFSFEDTKTYSAYRGIDMNGRSVGCCLFSVDGYNCYIHSIVCDFEDKLLVEGFIRSALNFCANRNAYMAYCDIDKISSVLTLLGFEKNDDVFSGDIPSLLKGSCCK